MTNATSHYQAKPPLGVGMIVGDSFRLFFSRFSVFFLLAFVPILIIDALLWLIIGPEAILWIENPELLASALSLVEMAGAYLLPLIGYAFATALIVLAAYDARVGHKARVGAYFAVAISRIVPIILVTIVVYICVAVGFVFLVIPGLYIAAMLSTAVTVVVVERMGMGAIGRSAFLTKDFRWQVFGTILVLLICVLVLGIVLSFVVGLIGSIAGITAVIPWIVINSALAAITNGIFAIGYVLIYARLREIKEGVTVQSLVEVFD